jgi:penicillin-binding protein-related factor A (putative recombinase)
MSRNNGKLAEQWFESSFKTLGKKVLLYAFEDYYQAQFKSAAKATVKAQPSDYLLTENSVFGFAEVKSSLNATSFPFADVRPLQWQYARKQCVAGGRYEFFILNLNTDTWYRINASYLLEHKDSGSKSIKWSLLNHCKWLPLVDKPTKKT